MFLRKTSRFKDGKVHDYWSVAENSRAGRRVVQRQLLYLGEIDEDRQNAWLNAISELDERKARRAADRHELLHFEILSGLGSSYWATVVSIA